jgi:hypothetical protein
MSERQRWADAATALQRLTPVDRRILRLLPRLPLLSALILAQIDGQRWPAAVYRSLARLTASGLVTSIRPPFRTGLSPRLYHLTDLGLVVSELDQGVVPRELARHHRLRAVDLRRLLPGLVQLVACYELLGALVASLTDRAILLAWERPWQRTCCRPTGMSTMSVRLPAYAVLAWAQDRTAFLLLPDTGTVPLRAYRAVLTQLQVLRRADRSACPPLIIAADEARCEGWRRLLDEVSRLGCEAPLPSLVVAWDALQPGLAVLDRWALRTQAPVTGLDQCGGWQQPGSAELARPIPRLIGPVSEGQANQRTKGEAARAQGEAPAPSDRLLLGHVGRHPFLTADGLAAVLGWPVTWARWRRDRLIARGLLRLLAPTEVSEATAAQELVELTAAGLRLLAAEQGLTVGAAVRYLGLVGGGPDHPIGPRRSLLRHLTHTLGVNALLAGLHRTAYRHARTGRDDTVVEWRNAASCARGRVRPDGYGLYRLARREYGFFLEYDRGTMSSRDYCQKFAAYHDYLASRRFARDYQGFPTILVVTTSNAAEGRIAQAVRAAAVGRGCPLPVLLTCEWRICADPQNSDGMLGQVWRETDPDGAHRRAWMVEDTRPLGWRLDANLP